MSHPQGEAGHTPEGGYERRDVSLRAITLFLVGLLSFMLAATLVGFGLHLLYKHVTARASIKISRVANYRRQPPEPRLQVDPAFDIVKLREAEDPILNTYGWVDAPNGQVRIPVQRAMQIVAERGLPTRGGSPSQ